MTWIVADLDGRKLLTNVVRSANRSQKINTVKFVRELTGLGLKGALDLVQEADWVPYNIAPDTEQRNALSLRDETIKDLREKIEDMNEHNKTLSGLYHTVRDEAEQLTKDSEVAYTDLMNSKQNAKQLRSELSEAERLMGKLYIKAMKAGCVLESI